MPRIYVEFSGLDQIGSRCKTVASRVDTIQSNFQRTVRQLDWDIRFESNINSTRYTNSKNAGAVFKNIRNLSTIY